MGRDRTPRPSIRPGAAGGSAVHDNEYPGCLWPHISAVASAAHTWRGEDIDLCDGERGAMDRFACGYGDSDCTDLPLGNSAGTFTSDGKYVVERGPSGCMVCHGDVVGVDTGVWTLCTTLCELLRGLRIVGSRCTSAGVAVYLFAKRVVRSRVEC